ncbi:MAG: glycosyltransferase [Selenomonadaceae bacterium]|nr:glycosyltransferase [Selenomonadaceae bacterium]
MKEKPFISILMTVYNNEKYFPISVKNIISQDYKNWELIIVDDASTDRTPAIADELGAVDDRITVIHNEKNLWVYASLNRAMEYAKGEYIFVHNSDDTLEAGSLRLMAEKAAAYDADIVWAPVLYHTCDAEQNIIEYDFTNFSPKYKKEVLCLTKEEVQNHWASFWQDSLSTNQVNLYRAKIMKKHRFIEDMFIADAIFNIEIADKINRTVTLDRHIYNCFRYVEQDGFNASFGKWYDNVHEIFNIKNQKIRELLFKWHRDEAEFLYWDEQRLVDFNTELYMLKNCCKYSSEKKIALLKQFCLDECFWNCVTRLHRNDEIRNIVIKEIKELNTPDENLIHSFDALENGVCRLTGNFLAWTRPSHQFDDLGNIMSDKNIYIYGAGLVGNEIYQRLKFLNCVDAFVDRSTEKQKNGFNGLPVISAEDYFSKKDTSHILLVAIENENIADSVERRLKLAGYIKNLDFYGYNEFIPMSLCNLNITNEINLRVYSLYTHNIVYLNRLALQLNSDKNDIDADIMNLVAWGIYAESLYILTDENDEEKTIDILTKLCRDYSSMFGNMFIWIDCRGDVLNSVLDFAVDNKIRVVIDICDYPLSAAEAVIKRVKERSLDFYIAKRTHWLSEVDEKTNSQLTEEKIIWYHTETFMFYYLRKGKIYLCRKLGDTRSFSIKCAPTDDLRKRLLEFSLGYADDACPEMCRECFG